MKLGNFSSLIVKMQDKLSEKNLELSLTIKFRKYGKFSKLPGYRSWEGNFRKLVYHWLMTPVPDVTVSTQAQKKKNVLEMRVST